MCWLDISSPHAFFICFNMPVRLGKLKDPRLYIMQVQKTCSHTSHCTFWGHLQGNQILHLDPNIWIRAGPTVNMANLLGTGEIACGLRFESVWVSDLSPSLTLQPNDSPNAMFTSLCNSLSTNQFGNECRTWCCSWMALAWNQKWTSKSTATGRCDVEVPPSDHWPRRTGSSMTSTSSVIYNWDYLEVEHCLVCVALTRKSGFSTTALLERESCLLPCFAIEPVSKPRSCLCVFTRSLRALALFTSYRNCIDIGRWKTFDARLRLQVPLSIRLLHQVPTCRFKSWPPHNQDFKAS